MKKIRLILITTIIINMLAASCVLGATSSITSIKDSATPLTFSSGSLSKKITKIDASKNEVDIELGLDIKSVDKNSEVVFVIDNSSSMSTAINNSTRQKEVISSTESLINKVSGISKNVKMGIVSFSSSATVVQQLTSDKNSLMSACETMRNTSPGGSTSINSALTTGKGLFSTDNNINKILILLSDGLPTDNYTDVKKSLQDSKYYIITALIGLDGENEKSTVESVFGTESNPTADKLYNIADLNIENVIVQDIYGKLEEMIKVGITNVEIDDYFPNDIIDNFDITLSNPTAGNAVFSNDNIKWNISNAKDNAVLKYTLKLKDKYNTEILNKVLNTNSKVDLSFINSDGVKENKTMQDSPQIKIVEGSLESNNNGLKSDNTTANKPLSNAGKEHVIAFSILALIIVSVVLKKILNKYKKI